MSEDRRAIERAQKTLPTTKSRTTQAFLEGCNTIALASTVTLAAITGSPLPILAGVLLEAAYLLFVPDSKWYQNRLIAKYDAEVVERRQKLQAQVFPMLEDETRQRFARLRNMRDQIERDSPADGRRYREVIRKLDYLLEKFLIFASKDVEFERYMGEVYDEVGSKGRILARSRANDETWVRQVVERIQEGYDHEIGEVDGKLETEENMHNVAVLKKRAEVLGRRKQYVVSIGEILVNLKFQLHLIEDSFGLINDEIRARSPEQVLADIEDVVVKTDSLTEALQEISPFASSTLEPESNKIYA